ncbi:hypothetical protein [Acinetobacter baumannii]|uniref:hypothetical protein n=1 Tax=Acinetobacter baumannii TaxID=470 RepID=UPI00189A7E40|nr:hypothetical protein [Acinetobacter baumannii]MBF6849998.1 hypothetical protein [Acinetobacter baumannii]
MPEGIFIQTNTGDIQIDGQSSHLYLGRKTTYTASKMDYTCLTPKSIIAIYLHDYANRRLRFDLQDNIPVGVNRVYSIEILNNAHYKEEGTFTVYEFMNMREAFVASSATNFGIEIYDESERPIFNSNMPIFRPVSYLQAIRMNQNYNMPLTTPSATYIEPIAGGTVGKKIAIVITQLGYQGKCFILRNSFGLNFCIPAFWIDEANGTFNLQYIWNKVAKDRGSSTAAVGNATCIAIAIDVTNM